MKGCGKKVKIFVSLLQNSSICIIVVYTGTNREFYAGIQPRFQHLNTNCGKRTAYHNEIDASGEYADKLCKLRLQINFEYFFI